MALLITAECINCAACESDCPNNAISAGDDIFVINPDRCTECVGHFEQSQCIVACPIDCIIPNAHLAETREQLQKKYERLTASAD